MRKIKKVEIGNCTLYEGDCWDVIETLKQVKFTIVSDPPYGIKMHRGNGKETRKRFKNDPKWDNEVPNLRPFLDIMDYAVFWGGNYFDLPPSRKYIVWDKGPCFRNNCFAACEIAWCSWDGNAKLISYNHVAIGRGEFVIKRKIHPAQKPVAVMEFCLNQLPESAFPILDPFMGSGTTAVAMIGLEMKRQFIGIEREKKYFEMAVNRIREAMKLHGNANV
jgi:DNA modification methylase